MQSRISPRTSWVRQVLLCLSLLLGLSAALPKAAHAAGLAEAVALMGEGSIDSVQKAVGLLGSSEEERALAILMALDAKQLKFDASKHAYIEGDAGVVDAITGQPAASPGELSDVLVNNAVRRTLGPAIAQLRLFSKDRKVRLDAASEIAKNPSDEQHALLERVLTTEKDSEVARNLRLGLAQLDMSAPDSAKKLAALAILKDDGNISHKPGLERLLQVNTDGTFAEADPAVRKAASAAAAAIDQRVLFINLAANLMYGLSLGSVLLLAALGLAITFGLMKVINMAHGEMLMIGAYSTFVVQNFFAEHFPNAQDYYLVAAIPVAFVVSGAVGLVLERGVIRFLYGRPLETLLATWGISLLLIQTVRLKFGAQNVTVSNPSWLSGGWELMPNVVLPYSRIATILFVVLIVTFVWLILNKTRLGLYVRAVTQNRSMAGNIGIPTSKIDMWTFVLGSGVAGLGGVAISQLGNVGPELGQSYIVDSFMVVVLGGVGSIFGTIAGALGLGLANKLLEPTMGAVLGKIALLVLLILFIQKRPQGIFALKGRAAEL